MVTDVASHYSSLLSQHYTWSLGDFADVLDHTRELFAEMELLPEKNGIAFDLGCGPGTHAIPLAELGFKVTALDTDPNMVDDLNRRKGGHLIDVLEEDMREFPKSIKEAPELITCMGDSLTLLEDLDDVSLFLFTIYKHLAEGGRLALSFRDQTEELRGDKGIFMLRSERDRIFTCALDYEEDYLLVTDLVHLFEDEQWRLEKSTYRKCRLRGEWLLEQLEECGFRIDFWQSNKGLISVLACKP
jgi:SAM-dependent methyltransferase